MNGANDADRETRNSCALRPCSSVAHFRSFSARRLDDEVSVRSRRSARRVLFPSIVRHRFSSFTKATGFTFQCEESRPCFTIIILAVVLLAVTCYQQVQKLDIVTATATVRSSEEDLGAEWGVDYFRYPCNCFFLA